MIAKIRKFIIYGLISLYFPSWLLFQNYSMLALPPAGTENSSHGMNNFSLLFTEISSTARDILKNSTEILFVTLINSAYLNLTRNWLCNTEKMWKIHENTLILCADRKSCDQLALEYPNTNFYGFDLDEKFGSPMSWGQKSYVSFLTFRAEILEKLTEAEIPFTLFETDATWFRDPT